MCKQLAQFRTRAHGSYVPTELYRSLGCTPPASSLRSKVTTMLRSDVCQGFATQVGSNGAGWLAAVSGRPGLRVTWAPAACCSEVPAAPLRPPPRCCCPRCR